jgi:hypothetical protein
MTRKSRTPEKPMPSDNGLGELLAELKDVADRLPAKIDNRVVLAAVIATRKEAQDYNAALKTAVDLNTVHRLDRVAHGLGWLTWKVAATLVVAGLLVWVALFALATHNQELLIALLGATR